jgi:hypothetical protein
MSSNTPIAPDVNMLVPPPPMAELGRQETSFLDFLDAIGEPIAQLARLPLREIIPNIPDSEFISDEEGEEEEEEEQPEGEENIEPWEFECLCNDPDCDCLLLLNNQQ